MTDASENNEPLVSYGDRVINPQDKDKIDKVFWSTGLAVAIVAAVILFFVIG